MSLRVVYGVFFPCFDMFLLRCRVVAAKEGHCYRYRSTGIMWYSEKNEAMSFMLLGLYFFSGLDDYSWLGVGVFWVGCVELGWVGLGRVVVLCCVVGL